MTENCISTSDIERMLDDTEQGKLLAQRAMLLDARRREKFSIFGKC
jgi:hypothetical protein